MIDLHSHILPGIDDGAADVSVSLAMARMFVADGVTHLACTPHILPGLYLNTGPQIRAAVHNLQAELDQAGIPLRLITGADVHMVPDLVAGLRSGRLLSLGDTRYVLVEPPHHVPPQKFEEFFFNILVSGYVPILTHPERLTWVGSHYAAIERMARSGVWMQITAGSLTGSFGRNAQKLAERMLKDGCVHIIATDAHDTVRRPPALSLGRDLAAKFVGAAEAEHLVVTRPRGILENAPVSSLPSIPSAAQLSSIVYQESKLANDGTIQGLENEDGQSHASHGSPRQGSHGVLRTWSERLRRVFD
ncbi:MAG: CpsB/CapC family capsule biosynthesis tyrosine phosphatase [Hyphomicrobiaceae bacterium]